MVEGVSLDLGNRGTRPETQVIDLTERGTPDAVIRLLAALSRVETRDLPDPLPTPPAVPMTDLGAVMARVGAETLTRWTSASYSTELLLHVEDVDLQPAVLDLAAEFGRRPDVVVGRSPSFDVSGSTVARNSVAGRSSTAAERSAQRAERSAQRSEWSGRL